MKCHRVEELLELLEPEWHKDSDLNLIQFLLKLAQEAGFKGQLEDLTDDVLIYHLKMRNSAKDEMIPGLKKITKKTSKPLSYAHAASSSNSPFQHHGTSSATSAMVQNSQFGCYSLIDVKLIAVNKRYTFTSPNSNKS